MSTSVLVAIAGVLVSAVGTGRLAGQCIRGPRASSVAWTVGMFAITVALLAQSIGFVTGFGAWTFRIVQLSAQLVAPLVLAWGLIELVARGTAVRFGAELVTAAVAAVAGVVLATDPLAATEFTKAWPTAAAHYQIIPYYALILVALVTGVTALTVLAVCAARRPGTPAGGPLVVGVAAVAVAVLLLIALRFSLPSPAYPALCAIAAGTLWSGMARFGDLAVRPVQADQADETRADAAAGAEVSNAEGADGVRRSRGFRGDRGSRGADDRRSRGPDDERRDPPAARPPAADDFGEPDFPPVGRPSARWDDRDQRDWPGRDWPGDRPRYQPGVPGSEPATGMFDASLPELGDIPLPASLPQRGADLALPVTPPHGLIAIYTLLDDKVADFDRAADEVAEQVRASEPDTLVYVIHTVPKAPMQRIFYEVYRDRAAYEKHEQQPYVQRFVTARRPYVLATNVIELRLKFAKVSPLPQAEAQAAQAQAQAQRPASAPNLPAVRNGNGGRPSGSRPAGSRPGGGRPDGPDYPSRDPGYRPRDPGYQLRDPGYPSRDPGYPPREPRYTPYDEDYPPYPSRDRRYPPRDARDPGYAPRDPRDPGYAPRDARDPGYAPRDARDPGYASRDARDPGYAPRDPRDPGYAPRDPQDPGYAPRDARDPGYAPRDPQDPGYPPPGRPPGRPREPRDWPRAPDDAYAEPRDPYDPPAASWYDRI